MAVRWDEPSQSGDRVVAEQVAGTRTGTAGAVSGVAEAAVLEGEAATSDARVELVT